MDTPQREYWDGQPASLGDAWRRHKAAKEPVCELFTHHLAFELRLSAGAELIASQVCRNAEQILSTQEQWRTAMVEKGWS